MRYALPLLISLVAPCCVPLRADSLPSPVVPQCVGVNIHFTGAPARDLDGLAAGGFGWVRMDFVWDAVEKVKGQYDFTAYDQLLDGLTKRGIKPLFILDYGNALYQNGSPRSPEAQAAFARFAAASVTHYKGRPILWEIWNEPNGGFWQPKADAEEYGRLAVATARAIKEADPKATVLAPGSAGIPLDFLEHIFGMGLLKYVDAVSLHPYRSGSTPPETAALDYRAVRLLIRRYAPKGKNVALVSSEWGYTTVDVPEERQAQFLARQWLSNVSEGVRLSIWYDWHEDGTDPKNTEHHFGTVRYDYAPKPAFLAAQALTQALRGYEFVKRLPLASDRDYLLLFARGPSVKVAAWTTGDTHALSLPSGLRLTLTGSPQYLSVSRDAALQTAASWTAVPTSPFSSGGEPIRSLLTWRGRDGQAHRVRFDLQPQGDPIGQSMDREQRVLPGVQTVWNAALRAPSRVPAQVHVSVSVDGVRQPYGQDFLVTPTDPVTLTIAPLTARRFRAQIDNPAGTPFTGKLSVAAAGERAVNLPLSLAVGGTHLDADAPVSPQAASVWALRDAQGMLLSRLSAPRFVALPGLLPLLKPFLDGDLKLHSTVEAAPTQAALAAGVLGLPALRVNYKYVPGWSFWRASPSQTFALPGHPTGMGLWVQGDGSGNLVRARFRDVTGQTFQTAAPDMTWTGWRFVSFRLVPPPGEAPLGHWGGADDGQVHYPVSVDTLLLLDHPADARRTEGAVTLAQPYALYGPE